MNIDRAGLAEEYDENFDIPDLTSAIEDVEYIDDNEEIFAYKPDMGDVIRIGNYDLIYSDIDSKRTWYSVSIANVPIDLYIYELSMSLEDYMEQRKDRDLRNIVDEISSYQQTNISDVDIYMMYIYVNIRERLDLKSYSTEDLDEGILSTVGSMIKYISSIFTDAVLPEQPSIFMSANFDSWLRSIRSRVRSIQGMMDKIARANTFISKAYASKYEDIKISRANITSIKIAQPVLFKNNKISTIDDLYDIFNAITCSNELPYARLNLVRNKEVFNSKIDSGDVIVNHKIYSIGGFSDIRRITSVPFVDDNGDVHIDNADIVAVDYVTKVFELPPRERSINIVLRSGDRIQRAAPAYGQKELYSSMENQTVYNDVLLIHNREDDIYKTITSRAMNLGRIDLQNDAFIFINADQRSMKTIIQDDVVSFQVDPAIYNTLVSQIPGIDIDTSYIDVYNIRYRFEIDVPVFNTMLFYIWLSNLDDVSYILRLNADDVIQIVNDMISFYISPSLAVTSSSYEDITKFGIKVFFAVLTERNNVRLRITVNKLSSDKQISLLHYIIIGLLSRFYEDLENYTTNNSGPIARYLSDVPILTNFTINTRESRTRTMDDRDNLVKLREFAPDLFTADVHGVCRNRSPALIDRSLKPQTQDNRIIHPTYVSSEHVKDYRDIGEVVMPFPPLDPKYYFISSGNNSFPYPGVTTNYGVNSDRYPYMPCNFKHNQMVGKGELYDNYEIYTAQGRAAIKAVRGLSTRDYSKYAEFMAAKLSGIIYTYKKFTPEYARPAKIDDALAPGKPGKLPRDIVSILYVNFDKAFNLPKDDETTFIRIATPFSINSAIHAILIALDDSNYIRSENQEAYVDDIRRNMIASVSPSIMSQELYDVTDEERLYILEHGRDNIDPFKRQDDQFQYWMNTGLFVALIEEYFNINLLVFTYDRRTKQGGFEIPRFKSVRITRRRDAPIVILLRYQNRPKYKTPQYNVIASYNKTSRILTTTFPYNDVLMNIKRIFMTDYNALQSDKLLENIIVSRNIYQQLDIIPRLIEKYTVIGQHIDAYGHVRAVNISYEDRIITIAMRPSQPINVDRTEQIYDATIEIAMKLFGQPSHKVISKIEDQKDVIVGLYFSVNIEGSDIMYAYVPIESINITDVSSEYVRELPISDEIWLYKPEHGDNGEYQIRSIIATKTSFYLQILYWIFAIARKSKANIMDYIVVGVRGNIETMEQLSMLRSLNVTIDENEGVMYISTETPDQMNKIITTISSMIEISPLAMHHSIMSFRDLKADLPQFTGENAVDYALQYIYQHTTGIVDIVNDFHMIVLTSLTEFVKVMYLYDKYINNILDEDVVIPNIVHNLYTTSASLVSDELRRLEQRVNTLIFTSNDDMSLWLSDARNIDDSELPWSKSNEDYKNNFIPIHSRVNTGDITNMRDAYMLIANIHDVGNNEMYIIQPVRDGHKISAFNVSRIWIEEGINSGYNTSNILTGKSDLLDDILINERYIIYRLIDGIPKPYIKHRVIVGENEEEPEFIQILEYADNAYAAMLPLQRPIWQ
jgi:hypothetical protein